MGLKISLNGGTSAEENMDVPAQEEEKKAKTNKNSNNYETPNILKWKKKLKKYKKNIK